MPLNIDKFTHYWPLIRIPNDDEDMPIGSLGSGALYLRDGEMVLLKIALRMICRQAPANDKYGIAFERIRHKIETIIDLEFGEGRFAPDADDDLGGADLNDKPNKNPPTGGH